MKQIARNHKSGELTGQSQRVAPFVDTCRGGTPIPISREWLLATTRAPIAVGESRTSGRPERV
jgi:hypothetical protein